MRYDIFHGKTDDAEALRQMAVDAHQRAEDSFSRCDTDGFLSQWANDITGRQLTEQAKIAENGGKSRFKGLYHGQRRIAAKVIECRKFNAHWATEFKWLLRDDEAARYGRRFIPLSGMTRVSRIQKQLGLAERFEMAPAKTRIGGHGKGLSGCTNAFVETYRTGCEWGTDAVLV